MDTRHDEQTFVSVVGLRRRLLGIGLDTLAREAAITPHLLAAVERGEVDPRGLHLLARRTLSRVLDLDL
ncbi:hypothetical protein DEDE109153_14635 [Deinococcus deserti]|uniref:HTH cro/C1-type domain-containing protein n=1 Tax=Deinococcus deserti (strain DSM 17065 / CIP 109153 / LMG 22923 / VCD115) TaxID=546414 RepID=C1CY32_DEIDV|nr:hypothetical protein [Deinococcus deserti]ACO46988.1 hypothetical protein Deide_19860 [Deinococcus deserti VCD115]